MVTLNDYGRFDTAWCPGCGNFSLLDAVKNALVSSNLRPQDVLFVSGIGQAAKAPHYLNANVFNGLHGRSLPLACGAKFANPNLTVIVESGDGCVYGEGGNHFLQAIRRNQDITLLVHNNQVYALTKGQASPTSESDFVTKAQPHGVHTEPFNPIVLAVAMKASFVARSFTGMPEHLTEIIKTAIAHRGFSIVDILQPCVTFNHLNTFAWYKKRSYTLDKGYDSADWSQAIKKAMEWGEKIPIGVIYKNGPSQQRENIPLQLITPVVRNDAKLERIMDKFR